MPIIGSPQPWGLVMQTQMSDDHTIAEAAAEVSDSELRAIERMAVELANLAGAEIVTALGSEFAVQYKTPSADENLWRDPVSEVDHRVETLIRIRPRGAFRNTASSARRWINVPVATTISCGP